MERRWAGRASGLFFSSLLFLACSSGKQHLTVTNDTTLAANFVWGPSQDDTIDWNTFSSSGTPVHAGILPSATSRFAVPPSGHYRWGALEALPDPKNPGATLQKLVQEGNFDSNGSSEITVHINGGAGGDGGASAGDGGAGTKFCTKPSDCPSGFCVTQICACDSQGHTKCPCTGSGASCTDDLECCSKSCGFNTNGICD